jgi:predicted MFS family arabinose efflux permease
MSNPHARLIAPQAPRRFAAWWTTLGPGPLAPDGRLLFATRTVRLFAYGSLSVVLVLYLAQAGLSGAQIGTLLTLALLGDTAISLWLTTRADRLGRRRILVAGAALMVLAGAAFALTLDFRLLLVAATIGVLSPSGHEVGPFLSIEQAALAQELPGDRRTQVFAWYNLAGSFATATGALAGGALAQGLQAAGLTPLASYRAIVLSYAAGGLILAGLFSRLTPQVEAPARQGPAPARMWGLHQSRRIVLGLAALFMLDAFGGGFVVQSIVAYWFDVRFGVAPAALGAIFFGANLLAGFSALTAARIARRFGLVRTMVFTHLPSNLLLMLVPLMPTLPVAVGLLLVRYSISQMDVPTRQSFTLGVVSPDERSAAAGVTGVARTIGAALSPLLAAPLLDRPAALGLVFVIAGGLKVAYDLALYFGYRAVKPPEESLG